MKIKGLSWRASAVVGAGFLGAMGSALAASGENSGQDLIVRYREPQNNLWQAAATIRGTAEGSAAQAEILNGAEGVLKLHFDSAALADRARARLELSGDVLGVSPDFLYRPAIHYKAHEVATAQDATFLSVPFVSVSDTPALPEVQLPPASVTPGADPLAAKDWALGSIRMPSQSALDESVSAQSLVIAAVIDTGIDYNHEDLSGALWRNPDNAREVGYDFAHNNDKPYDLVHFDVDGCMKDLGCGLGINQGTFLTNPGHGTHCAGHVGAVANNSVGIRGVGGNRSQVMGLKFFYDAGDPNAGQGDDAAAIKSIDYAITHGAKVISASWGGRQKRADGEGSEIKQALLRAQKAGVIVVVAAGNDGIDQDSVDDPDYPAAYDLDNLIVVAASGQDDKVADFSNFGAHSVHIAAPGVKILSTTSGGSYNDVVTRFKDSSGKLQELDWDGTSMATPIVAGAVALVWSKFPTDNYHQIRDRILKSARTVPALAGKVSTAGVLNVAAALGAQ